MSTARIPDGTPLGLVQVGLAEPTEPSLPVKCLYCLRPYPGDGTLAHHQDWCPLAGRSDPPVKPTSEVAHQPGQQPAAWRCPEHDGACEFCWKFGCDACDRDIERQTAGDV